MTCANSERKHVRTNSIPVEEKNEKHAKSPGKS
jgi:hypothetical protein